MRFAVLGSGSGGNATLIEAGATRLLLDCGFALREIERRLRQIDVDGGSIDACVLTHEHGDHVRGVAQFARRHGAEVWASPGTWKAAACPEVDRLRLFTGHARGFRVGDLSLRPIPVPHDAREPCQFVVEANGSRLGILTDAGTVTPRICEQLRDCDALVLEANHDPRMLREGPYPPALRRRVGGPFGHLSNRQAAELLDAVRHPALKRVLLAHVSAKNNRPELATAAVGAVDGRLAPMVSVAAQDRGTGWIQV